MILDQLEKAFMVIGDKVITVGSGSLGLDDFDVQEENITSELVVRPRAALPRTTFETRQSLNNMTKQAICDLAVERYGVDMNFRTEKKQLITEFLALQDEEDLG